MEIQKLTNNLSVINDVSESIKQILENNIEDLPPNSVSFDSPAELQKSGKTGVSLFLYKITENPDLKNQVNIPLDSKRMKRFPMTVDLSYLLTPFSQTRESEQVILAKIMQLFHDNPSLSGTMLKDSLRDTGTENLRVLFDNIPLEQLNNLWGTFHEIPYKCSLSYLVTPVIIPSSKIEESSRVESKEIVFENIDKK